MDPLFFRPSKPAPTSAEQVADLGLFAEAEPKERSVPGWLAIPTSDIERAFKVFDTANPNVYRLLEAAALAAQRTGAPRIGIAKLVEDIRYNPTIATTSEPFKLNNNFRALYARLLVHRHPSLQPLFVLRERREPESKAS